MYLYRYTLSWAAYLYTYRYEYIARNKRIERKRNKNTLDWVMDGYSAVFCDTWLELNTRSFGRSVTLSYSKLPGRFDRKIEDGH